MSNINYKATPEPQYRGPDVTHHDGPDEPEIYAGIVVHEPVTDITADQVNEAIEHTIIEDKGLLIDNGTGEIMGMVGAPPTFFVDTPEAAGWVLRKMMEEEGALADIRAQQSAIMANLDKMAGERVRRLGWLHWRYDHELADFAKNELARTNSKTKTWRCAWGLVSFRLTKGTNKIIDMKSAVIWAKRHVPTAIKTAESVSVTDLLPHLEEFDPKDRPEWLESTPGGEKVTVETGVTGAK